MSTRRKFCFSSTVHKHMTSASCGVVRALRDAVGTRTTSALVRAASRFVWTTLRSTSVFTHNQVWAVHVRRNYVYLKGEACAAPTLAPPQWRDVRVTLWCRQYPHPRSDDVIDLRSRVHDDPLESPHWQW